MWEGRWLLLTLYGVLLATAVTGALKVTRPKFKIATTSTSTEEPQGEEVENGDSENETTASNEGNGTTRRTLTGIPQIDYIWDPNLPRELNGYNLSEYPFYSTIPEDIDFKCDGLHDGFYASVLHKCQVYHHCLFGTRFDFLCANFTAFDQKTFICQFVSEVDCINSKKYWHRNDALYQAATTSTSSTTTTTTTTTTTPASVGRSGSRDREPARRRRPFRRRPAYDYYEDYYDEEYDRARPRGYDRRDYDDYEERQYRRERNRDRDLPRPRDPERPLRDDREKDRETSPRERFPTRVNRRNPLTSGKDLLEEEPRIRNRDQEGTLRSKDTDDSELDNRKPLNSNSRNEEGDDHRYTDKRSRDDYDEKETAPMAATIDGDTEGLVKPASPSASVYSRPRAPPKIRRPVPISEQDRYAYKVTSTQATVDESRRRPADLPLDDEYYDDDLEDVRPRRPLRRRPQLRERDRDFYETRDRDLDRPYRTRYRDEEDDVRPRKHPERSRDRYYDRERGLEHGRDRLLDREKDKAPGRMTDREKARTSSRTQESERPIQARLLNREREFDRFKPRMRGPQESHEPTQKTSIHERTTISTITPTTSAITTSPLETIQEQSDYERSEEYQENSGPSKYKLIHVAEEEETTTIDLPENYWRPTQKPDLQKKDEADEYETEYYDEEETVPTAPPRTAIKIVKRPVLPSKEEIANPRGLQNVNSKGPAETEITRSEIDYKEEQESKNHSEDKSLYNAYKVIQTDMQHERPDEYEQGSKGLAKKPGDGLSRRPEEYNQRRPEESIQRRPEESLQRRPEEPIKRRPEEHQRHTKEHQRRPEEHQRRLEEQQRRRPEDYQRRLEKPLQEKTTPSWTVDYHVQNTDQVVPTSSGSPLRNNGRVIPVSELPNHYYNGDIQDQPSGPANYRSKQRLNEVTRLQDIPESEYDVTLNEALTPTLNQETSFPSGFTLPLHRQFGRDAILQPSENSYKFSRPVQQQQQQQQQQRKSFVPSQPFIPATPIAKTTIDRPKTFYYRIPETVQISENQYRQQRGPWHDYTRY